MFQYRVKVRGKTYLWGGEGIQVGLFQHAFLMLRVDELGESVKISQMSLDFNIQTPKLIGTLKRGEALTIDLRTLGGVWAEVTNDALDTNIDCMLVPGVD